MKSKLVKKLISMAVVGTMAASMLAGCGNSGSGNDSAKTENTGDDASKDTSGDDASKEDTSGDDASKEDTSGDDASGGDGSVDTTEVKSVADVGYKGEPVELSFWYLTTRQEGTEELTKIFNEANPNINVTVSYYDTDGIKDACKTAAQSGSMPSLWFNWGGALGQYYVDNGVTYDFTEYAKEHKWDEVYSPGAMNLVTLGGQISGIPTSYNVLGMYYRTDLFEQCGIEVPKTIEEFDAACAKLKENGITPISTAGLNGWHVMRLIEQFIEYEAGAEEHDKLQSLTASWDCDAVKKGLERYQKYCQEGYFPDGFVTASPDDTYMAFAMGSCAMDIQGQWYDSTLQNNGVTLDNVSWFPFPNETGRMSAFAEMNQFNKNLTDDELEAAIAYTNFLFSNEAARVYPTYYNLPLPRTDADPVDAKVNPNVQNMIDTSSEGGTFTITDQAFPTEVADVLFNYQDAIANNEHTPEEAAKAIQEAIEAYQNK
ncbi:MAG: extracellular solute-binding protein [Eubacterium sp.]|nr:extracellular solute-binding protein [Eubacterium sp.]